MPNWAGTDNQAPAAQDDMVSPEGFSLTVDDAITGNGALNVTGLSTLTGGAFIAGGIEMEVDGDDYHIDINDVGSPLLIATNEEAGHVHIGKPDNVAFDDADVIVESPRLRVGQNDAVGGYIDANGNGADQGRPLLIGNTHMENE